LQFLQWTADWLHLLAHMLECDASWWVHLKLVFETRRERFAKERLLQSSSHKWALIRCLNESGAMSTSGSDGIFGAWRRNGKNRWWREVSPIKSTIYSTQNSFCHVLIWHRHWHGLWKNFWHNVQLIVYICHKCVSPPTAGTLYLPGILTIDVHGSHATVLQGMWSYIVFQETASALGL